MAKITITISIADDVKAAAAKMAAAERRSLSSLIQLAIEHYLEVRQIKDVRFRPSQESLEALVGTRGLR